MPTASSDNHGLHGLKLKLERGEETCCRNIAVVRVGNYGAELVCAMCGAGRGGLGDQVKKAFLHVFAIFPEAKLDVHVLRESSPQARTASRA